MDISGWTTLPDEELLATRVRDLGLKIDGSPLEEPIAELYGELDAAGLAFRPPCYLADEWLCPDRVPIIGIPFFLAHPRLKKLEQKMMFEVEGGTVHACMQLLRHEAGHAINYAYRLYARTRWRELFGRFSAPYLNSYTYQPYSRRYVVHLPDNYAQAHPDEDFAETFAVWLDPASRWRDRYAEWPALRKLEYVDRVMQGLRGAPPLVRASQTPWSAARMRSTLAAFYERRRRVLGQEFPGYYDGVLRKIFRTGGEGEPAPRFLRRNRETIMNSVARWTGHRKYDVHSLIAKLVRRCDALGLRVAAHEKDTLVETAVLICAVASKTAAVDEEGSRHA